MCFSGLNVSCFLTPKRFLYERIKLGALSQRLEKSCTECSFVLSCLFFFFFWATACCVFFLPLPPAWWGERLGRTVIQTETVLMNHLCHSVIQWSWKIKQQFQLTLSLWLFFLLLLIGEKFYFNPLEAVGMERISVWAGHIRKHTPEIRRVPMKPSILSGAGHAGCGRG